MFQGFSDQTIDFMWGIRFNNEKPWFEAHKEAYLRTLYEPMKALNREVCAALQDEYPDLGLIGKVSRIYRDARRLRGRGPYKDRLWMTIERPSEQWSSHPVFWFELAPEDYSFGMGYYRAPPAVMAKLRTHLDQNPKPFEALVKQFNTHGHLVLEAEPYKRPKGDPGALLYDWYNARSFSLNCKRKHDKILYSPALVEELIQGYRDLMPLYQYFITLESELLQDERSAGTP